MKAKRLLCLYPRAWRIRYEAEYTVLLEEIPLSARVVFDIVRGAVDARLHPRRFRCRRRRAGWITVCLFLIIFALPARPVVPARYQESLPPAYQA